MDVLAPARIVLLASATMHIMHTLEYTVYERIILWILLS